MNTTRSLPPPASGRSGYDVLGRSRLGQGQEQGRREDVVISPVGINRTSLLITGILISILRRHQLSHRIHWHRRLARRRDEGIRVFEPSRGTEQPGVRFWLSREIRRGIKDLGQRKFATSIAYGSNRAIGPCWAPSKSIFPTFLLTFPCREKP